MADIFDEVDEMLNEAEILTSGSDESEILDKSFNDSELQDIMSEIESLENDFEPEIVTEPMPGEVLAKADPSLAIKSAKKTELQNEIDKELEMSLQVGSQTSNTSVSETVEIPESKVLTFEKSSNTKELESTMTQSKSEISFEAQGQMNLNLGFKIGEETATLSIDPVKGLTIIMSGVELCISQDQGCVVTMDSGVKFTIPLTSTESSLKKKTA